MSKTNKDRQVKKAKSKFKITLTKKKEMRRSVKAPQNIKPCKIRTRVRAVEITG